MEVPKELYLDTNMIWTWFRNFMVSLKNNNPIEIPDILQFITNKKELKLFTTTLTQIEIFRYLKAEWDRNEKSCNEIWNTFINSFNITLIEVQQVELEELLSLVSKVATKKKTLVNLMHLQVARKNNLWFLSGEENLKDKYKEYYDKVLTYEDLRKLYV